MSRESIEWLNQNVLIGQTDKRGTAWHYRASDQGDESNHYDGFIPVEDVERRLFGWEPVGRKVAVLVPVYGSVVDSPNPVIVLPNGDTADRFGVVMADEWMAACDDNNVVLGVHGSDYAIHSYKEWLLRNVATILDADLGVTSAGLLRQRRQAWVEVSVPDTVEMPEGVTFRPNLLAGTSLDSSLSTFYKRTVTNTVCDNTLRAAMGENGQEIRFKHTSGSLGRIAEARQALSIVYQTADDFQDMVRDFLAVEVSDKAWQQIVDKLAPYPRDPYGQVIDNGRSFTIADRKREKLDTLYRWDSRCAPWIGTKYGVVQTANTWMHHFKTVRGAERAERNMTNVLSGQVDAFDQNVGQVVDDVLSSLV